MTQARTEATHPSSGGKQYYEWRRYFRESFYGEIDTELLAETIKTRALHLRKLGERGEEGYSFNDGIVRRNDETVATIRENIEETIVRPTSSAYYALHGSLAGREGLEAYVSLSASYDRQDPPRSTVRLRYGPHNAFTADYRDINRLEALNHRQRRETETALGITFPTIRRTPLRRPPAR